MRNDKKITLQELSEILGEPIRQIPRIKIEKRKLLNDFTENFQNAFKKTKNWVKNTKRRYGLSI